MEGLEFDLWFDLGCFRCFVVACLIGIVGDDVIMMIFRKMIGWAVGLVLMTWWIFTFKDEDVEEPKGVVR